MPTLVSILIPAYNAERWIADTIQSALAQTWPCKEIIIVDDGSRDRTLEIAQRFASRDVLVVTQQNQGAATTRNRAFELCQGDYIQWLDADDLLSPDKVARQVVAAQESQDKRRLLSSGWGYFMYRPDKAKFVPTALWCDLTPVEWLLRKWEQNLHMQTATWLVSRELTEVTGAWDSRLMGDDDGEYFCRALLASSGVSFVPEAKVFYRVTDSNRWSYIGQSQRKLEAHLLSRQLQIGYLRSLQDDERVRIVCLKYLQRSFFNFYPERVDLVRQMQQLAAMLGGQLEIPKLPWKYRWIQELFGFTVAKRARQRWNRSKSFVIRSWDKAAFHLEARNATDLEREASVVPRCTKLFSSRKSLL
jgi:glycosyltransferase involved in cell wall biosynthesis